MKVHRRGASSPSLLLEASEPPTSVNVNGNYYQFELEPHHVERGKRGQKVFVCDLCPAPGGVFKRSFSLKRHYLRFHINFAFLSPRDLNNCAIAIAGQHQRSGFPPTGPNDRLINRLNNSSPLLFRCHQCGRLLRTKNDLLKHLEAHPGPSQTVTEENGDGDRQQGGTNRCPRCSTAFSLRKTLMRHIKKNRCRGGNPPPPLPDIPDSHSKPESETGIQSGETSDPGDDYLAMGPEEESEEMDMEASLRLGSPTSLFRFACTLCNKMFNSYVNMCRHRRLAHGRYGICSPHWLLSRKLSNKPSLKHAVQSPINSSRNPQIYHDLSHIVTNANDNLNRFIDGKRNNIRSLAPTDDRFEVQPTDSGDPPPERWSWGETSYNATELQKLDVPLQMVYYNGLKSLKLQETAKTQSSSSQSASEEMDISKVLDLRTVEISSREKVTAISQPEFSGEWIRSKNYICSPCGEIFQDFLALLDHQQNGHSGVWCTHIQLDQSTEAELADELKRQIMRSGNGGQILPLDTFQCTKCHFSVESIPELHSHILLCSNHVSASPYRKRRVKVNPRSRRGHWNQNEAPNGGSRGVQRTNSSLTKNSSAARSLRSRSPKEDATDKSTPGALRRSTRRVLSFSEPAPTKKKNGITKRILRQRVDPLLINGSAVSNSVQSEVKKKNGVSVNSKSTSKIAVDVHECDGCQKQFQSHTSVLKHKHYCPKKSNESSGVPNNAATPVSSKNQSNGLSKAQTKILAYETVKTEPNLGRPNTKRKSEVLSTSPIKKLKVAVPSEDINHRSPSSNSDSPKKISRKSVSSATPTQVSFAKTPAKPKSSLKSIAGPAKSNRSTTKKGNQEIEEIAVAAEGRPVRSSRKVSMTLAMEDQVEASFLEALSPEQRVRVAEQKCPFCSKHYVYRSNFKRHLLEGCDTIDVDEPSVNLTPTSQYKKPSDDKINKEKKSSVSSSSVLKVERKEKRQTIESDLKNIEKKPLKKKNSKAEEIPEGKMKKTVEKKSDKTPQNISKLSKLQELKKSTETRSRKEAVKLTDVPSQSNQKAKQIHSKKTQQNRNGKSSEREEENMNNVTKVRGEENITTNSDKFDLPKINGRKPTAAPKTKKSNSPSLSTDIVTLVEDEAGCSDQEDEEFHSNNGVDHQLEKTANQTQGDDQIDKSTFTEKDREPECNHLKIDGSKILNGNCGSNRALRSSTTSQYDLNKLQSHALDRLKLGQALDNAISEIFKSYTYFTKYPIQIRLLKNLAQAYLQPTSY